VYQRILVPYDGSDNGKRALQEAIRLAKDQHARLRVIHVLEEMPWQISSSTLAPIDIGPVEEAWEQAGKEIIEGAAKLTQAAGVTAETQLIETLTEAPGRAIMEEVGRWQPDLIVMGTHGRHGLERMFIGSVAERVVRLADVPVLLIHGQEGKLAQ
jgi:nucleotide-binding universal stress UspA family protein